jgi:hypothetical protein
MVRIYSVGGGCTPTLGFSSWVYINVRHPSATAPRAHVQRMRCSLDPIIMRWFALIYTSSERRGGRVYCPLCFSLALHCSLSVNTNLKHEQRPDHVAPINYHRPAGFARAVCVCARHQKNNTVRLVRTHNRSTSRKYAHIQQLFEHGHTCVGTRVIKKQNKKMLNNRFTFPKCGWPFKCGYMRESRAGKHILCKRVAHFLVLGLINSQPSPVPLFTYAYTEHNAWCRGNLIM